MVQLTEEEVLYQLTHAHEDRRKDIIYSHSICIALAAVAVLLRFLSRYLGRIRLGPDDWTILAGFIFGVGEITGGLLALRYGGGRHAILLPNPNLFARIVIAVELCNFTAITLVKFSLLLLYARIFPSRRFRIVLYAFAAFIFCEYWAQTLTAIFQCHPIEATWTPTIEKADCIKFNHASMFFTAVDGVTDVLLCLLPVPLLLKLELAAAKKLQLLGIFLTGGFVCVVSFYRVPKYRDLNLKDASYSDVDPALWSAVEVCVGIFGACLPTLRPLIIRVFRPFRTDYWSAYFSGPSSLFSSFSEKRRSRKMYAGGSGGGGGRESGFVRFEDVEMKRRGVQLREMGTQTEEVGVEGQGISRGGIKDGGEAKDSAERKDSGEMEMRVGSPSRNFSRIIPSPPASSQGKGRGRVDKYTFPSEPGEGFESARWRMERVYLPGREREGGQRDGRDREAREYIGREREREGEGKRYTFLNQKIPSGELHAL